ncbi:hypothetical protein BLX24_27170 [Arsenicibacter rosenii]|uniref:Transposase DDE domain-containing protein n=1 Tax=Arsenicibacter rosenii TaxID=1750698 RepID=A0A1S2VDP3_9BACT|nr:hypothetical protein [Arsenicibacter rosenii]OIN56028.1 hypothetical protein BLX24_27170 [Arsenicibacter rosenii]
MLEKSAFNRRLHRLAYTLSELFYYLADFFKVLNISGKYVVDSFPVAVYDNICIGRSRLLKGEEYRGKIASKQRFFFASGRAVGQFNSSLLWTNNQCSFSSCRVQWLM